VLGEFKTRFAGMATSRTYGSVRPRVRGPYALLADFWSICERAGLNYRSLQPIFGQQAEVRWTLRRLVVYVRDS